MEPLPENKTINFFLVLIAFGMIAMGSVMVFFFSYLLNRYPANEASSMIPFINAGYIAIIAGCFFLTWYLLRRRGVRLVFQIESKLSIHSVLGIVAALFYIAAALTWFLSNDYLGRSLNVIILCVLGSFMLVFAIATWDRPSRISHVQNKKRNDDFSSILSSIRENLLKSPEKIVNLRKISRLSGLHPDQLLREVYRLAGMGEIEGKFIHTWVFKFETSIVDIVGQIDKIFNAWSSSHKLMKI